MDFSDESRSVNPGGMRDSMTGVAEIEHFPLRNI